MHVDVVWLTAALFSFPLLALCDPLNVLVAPNLLRVGTLEKVLVEAQDYTGNDLQVRVRVMSFPQKRKELTSVFFTLTAANNYQDVVNIKINANDFIFDDPLDKHYVYLQAHFPTESLEKVVLLSFQSGYIFVQTDKSIYTPGTNVRYRIFSLTPDLQPNDQTGEIYADIVNPQGLIIYRNSVVPEQGTTHLQYSIPEFAKPGIWSIVARYKSSPQKNFTAEFEVKEYVLPSFEVALRPSKPYLFVDDNELHVDITAKYVFGKDVDGIAFVVFGITKDGIKSTLTASLKREQITKGKGRAVLTREMIQQSFPNVFPDLVGSSLYVSVSILTQTGTDMVEAKRGGIRIVTSPFTINFDRSPRFFKAGIPFDLTVHVNNPDQLPAENVDVLVQPGGLIGRTKRDGMAKFTVNTEAGASTLKITARTTDAGISPERQAVNTMTAQAYTTKEGSSNYLYISVNSAELEVGEQTKINIFFKSVPQNHDFTYLILSKGQIVKAGRFKRQGQALVALPIHITKDLLPSFRVVAYYHIGSSEVVSDSIWVEVKDTCMGTLKLDVRENLDVKKVFEPGAEFHLMVTGDPSAKVGLVAVDKAVFVLNKNRLTQTKAKVQARRMASRRKIWDIIEKHDTGCTAGSGKDSMGVFYDAGLLFQSDKAGGTDVRTAPECPTRPKRKRRAETLLQFSQTQSDEENADGYVSSDEINSRTNLAESWLWEDITLPACQGNLQCATTSLTLGTNFLKDSITTWQVLAISLSKTHGICVADPYEITVAKDVFVDLKMPSSAIRNERLEIKAIVHNFSPKEQEVRVEFFETPHVCSAASKKDKYRTVVSVDAKSSKAIPYVIIPMEIGTHRIEVQAAGGTHMMSDGVRKILKVVSEGVLTEHLKIKLDLNPSQFPGSVQVLHLKPDIPDDQVPNTPAYTYITVTGQSQRKKQVISGDFMGRLIVQPDGSGESVMISMTLSVIATHYLDTTNQWDKVGMHRRSEAIQHIITGYAKELTFRKADGSYSAWTHTPSSTWLTAYVAKVLALAYDIIAIDQNVICGALKWLILNGQVTDGIFIESTPVVLTQMVGNVPGKDGDVSLTAFVLIALQEASQFCFPSVIGLPEISRKAAEYLEHRLPSLANPYAVAMSSYALANAGRFNKDRLLQASSEGGAYWNGEEYRFSLEATAYALLALVKAKEFDAAEKAVNWLNRQRYSYGSDGSTQATIMVFQAMAEYYTHVREQQTFDLDVEVSERGRGRPIRWRFSKDHAQITRSSFQVHHDELFTVTAKGTGAGILKVETLYYAKPTEKKSDCSKYNLSVQMKKEQKVSDPHAEESYKVIIDLQFKDPNRDATLTVLDISLLTGFVVDESDLKTLTSGRDKSIPKFEMEKQLSDRGSLILYLDKVSHTVPDRIVFRVHQIIKVALLQPAAVSVYEYYSPGQHCVKFYHPTASSGPQSGLDPKC